MKLLRRNSSEPEVLVLQELLSKWGFPVASTGVFSQETEDAVKQFQRSQSLSADGIVGKQTWERLNNADARELRGVKLSEADFTRAARQLGVDVAVIKAVQKVETGGKGGFLKPGHPTILFEGHIFWGQLEEAGMNPKDYVLGNEDILYQKWTKEHYKGGMKEYDRLERAMRIDPTAAFCSASWGMFQIMGFNHQACGCGTVTDFVNRMSEGEGSQLDLFVRFLENNNWHRYLQALNWAEFARRYNGPGYAQNKYDEKLAAAYRKYGAKGR